MRKAAMCNLGTNPSSRLKTVNPRHYCTAGQRQSPIPHTSGYVISHVVPRDSDLMMCALPIQYKLILFIVLGGKFK